MRVAIVSPPIQISGGMKEKLLLAKALAAAGHEVDIVTPDGSKLGLLGYQGRWVAPERALKGAPYDVAVVTWYETFDLALKLGRLAIHFCQGNEVGLLHLRDREAAIRRVYERALPALVVSPHLGQLLASEFGTRCVAMRPLLDPFFTPRFGRFRPQKPPTIIVHGIFEAPVKRVPLALAAVEIFRQRRDARLLRISSFRRSAEEEKLSRSDAFHVDVPPMEVARLTAGADVTLFTSDATEGFGLPVLDSLAAGVPVVATRIPSLSLFEHSDTIATSAEDRPEHLAECLENVLVPSNWALFRRRGIKLARVWKDQQFRFAAAAFAKTVALG